MARTHHIKVTAALVALLPLLLAACDTETTNDPHSGSGCDSNTPRGNGVSGRVVGDKYRRGGPYCLEIWKSGYQAKSPNDNSGIVWIRVKSKTVFDRCNWNADWPDCQEGR